MNGFNNYNAYTSYLTPQTNGYSASNYIQNQLGIPSMQQPMMQQQPQLPAQQFFAQPSGQLFSINNSNELQNIPVQEGTISAIINPNENMLYLKTLQNGKHLVLDYQLKGVEDVQKDKEQQPIAIGSPANESPKEVANLKQQVADLNSIINKMSKRIDQLEKKNNENVGAKKVNPKKEGVE